MFAKCFGILGVQEGNAEGKCFAVSCAGGVCRERPGRGSSRETLTQNPPPKGSASRLVLFQFLKRKVQFDSPHSQRIQVSYQNN